MDFDGTKLSDTINDDYEDSTMLAHSFYTQEAADPATSTRITFLDLDRYQARQDLSAQELALLFALQFSAKVGEIVPIFDAKHHLSKVFIGSELGREDEALATAVTRLPVGRYYSANVLSEQALLSWGKAQYRYQAFSKLQTLPRVLAIPLHQSYAVIAELEAIFLARDLINAPANIMGPAELVEVMTKLAKVHHAEVETESGLTLFGGNVAGEQYRAGPPNGRATCRLQHHGTHNFPGGTRNRVPGLTRDGEGHRRENDPARPDTVDE